ncbi:MAG: M16 family metallopeptidase, partial [Planctomycetota bacterium]
REEFDNGLVLIVDQRSDSHAVELRLSIEAGPLYEGGLLGSGASELLRRVVVGGVERGRITTGVRGGRLASALDVSATAYAVTTTDDNLAPALALLAGVLADRSYSDEDVERARGDQLMALTARQQDPQVLARDASALLALRRHPARYPVVGRPALLASVDAERLRTYHEDRYRAPHATLYVVGNVSKAQVRTLVAETFVGAPRGGRSAPAAVVEPIQYRQRHEVLRLAVDSERHVFTWRVPPAGHPQRLALELAAASLADERYSPLSRLLREAQLAERITVSCRGGPGEPGLFRIGYTPFPGRASQARQALEQALLDLGQQGPDDVVLEVARRGLLRERLRSTATVAGLAVAVERWDRAIGVPSYAETERALIENGTVEIVRAAVAALLHPQGSNLSRLVLLPRATAVAESGDPALALSDVPPRLERLPSGARLLMRRMPIGLADLRVTIAGGGLADPVEHRGASALLARLLRYGSVNLNGDELADHLARHGMELTSSVDAHTIELGLTCFPEDVASAVDVLVDIVANPALPPEVVARAVENELAAQSLLDHDGEWWQLLQRAARGAVLADDHGGRDWRGHAESLSTIDRDVLLAHHRQLTSGGRIVFSAYGAFDSEALRAQLVAHDERVVDPGQPWQPIGPAWAADADSLVTSQTWDRSDSAVCLVWRAPALDALAADGAAMDVVGALLVGASDGGGTLARSLSGAGLAVGQLALAEEHYPEQGLWMIQMLLAEDRRQAAVDGVRVGVAELVERMTASADSEVTLSDRDIDAARRACVVHRVLDHEDQKLAARAHSRALLLYGGYEHDFDYQTRIAAVTRADLARVATAYLDREPVVVQLQPASVNSGADSRPVDEPAVAPVERDDDEGAKP